MQLPSNIADLLQQMLSAKRIANFLASEDTEYFSPANEGRLIPAGSEGISIRGTIAWVSLQDPVRGPMPEGFALRNVDVHFPPGKMTLIAGKFGSGKSLMLLTLLGETRVVSGTVYYASSPMVKTNEEEGTWDLVPEGVAYVPQVGTRMALLLSTQRFLGCKVKVSGKVPEAIKSLMSFRDNVLFGLPLEVERYRAVVYVRDGKRAEAHTKGCRADARS